MRVLRESGGRFEAALLGFKGCIRFCLVGVSTCRTKWWDMSQSVAVLLHILFW